MKSRVSLSMVAGIVLATVPGTLAQTPVGGLICEDTTWYCDQSPYLVTADAGGSIMIGCDATLTIEPCVEVRFEHGLGLTVGHTGFGAGTLVARGTRTSQRSTPRTGEPTTGRRIIT